MTTTVTPTATVSPTICAAEPIGVIYALARSFSASTRARVQSDAAGGSFAPPTRTWHRLIENRRKDGACLTLATAGRQLVRFAVPAARPYVKKAVRRLCEAVAALGQYVPEYESREYTIEAEEARAYGLSDGAMTYSTWTPTAVSVARLDELRNAVRCRLVELSSLFEIHNDPLSRVMSVAKRIAGFVLEPTAAVKVANWCGQLERGGGEQRAA